VNNIDFEPHLLSIQKGEHRTPEFRAINPLGKLPCIVDGRFKLAESHAIMEYLAATRPGVADHWYPTDVQRRSKINSVLDWHHLNLRRGSMTLVFHTVIAPILGVKADPRAAAEGLAILQQSLDVMETVWLQPGYPFLAGGRQPSIADLSLVCEIMQLQALGEDEAAKLLSSKERVTAWIAAVKKHTSPHFDEVHKIIYKVAARSQALRKDGNKVDSKPAFSRPARSKL
jgi:glutathione S-transferase